MLQALHNLLSGRSAVQIAATSLLLVAIVGTVDYLTGYELSFSVFYLIPVGVSSWYAGNRLGIPASIISALTWLVVDYNSGHQYSHIAILFWNASVRLGFFLTVTYLLVHLHRALELQISLAQQDGLTGLTNTRSFLQRYNWLVPLAIRYGHPMAIGYLDLDGFKGINDSLGHSAGDLVLKAVAVELGKGIRGHDVVARLGGDEFAILLTGTDLAGAKTFFTRKRESLIALAACNHWAVGFSIGVALFRSPPADPKVAVKCADDLMYKVKSTGKNNILFDEYPAESHRA